MKVSTGPCSLWRSRKGASLLPPSFCGFLTILGVSWLVDTSPSLRSLPVSSHSALPVPLCPCFSFPPLFFFFNIYLAQLHYAGSFSCGTRDRTQARVLGVWSLSHWTNREAPVPPSYKDTSHTGWGAHPTPIWPHLNLHLSHICKAPICK